MASDEQKETSPVILHCFTNEQRYLEALEQTASFNTKLSLERKMRLPFLDSQTGVAQRHTQLLHPYRHRQPGNMKGQLYTYPAKRWKKKKGSFFASDPRLARHGDIETGEADLHQISAVENPAHHHQHSHHREAHHHHTAAADYDAADADGWYDELDELHDPPDAAEADDHDNFSDYEEQFTKSKKKKKAPARGGRRKKVAEEKDVSTDDKDKPYACDVCGARYKTRPGLAYHHSHFHNGMIEEEAGSPAPKPSLGRPPANIAATSVYSEFKIMRRKHTPKPKRSRSDASSRASKAAAAAAAATVASSPSPAPATPAPATAAPDAKGISANNYCDFCLGDATQNLKTKSAEELVSCSDCGRSGHPTCLQFTDNMIISVKRYPWQCIECKSCGICGTSDNDDQLLFCDDCDRGYHMYCLKPPLSEPPEGSWSCHLCIEEFHGGKKPAGMA